MLIVRLELKKGLKGVKEFLVVTKLCQLKCLLGRILIWFATRKSLCLSKWEVFCSGCGVERVFSDLFR